MEFEIKKIIIMLSFLGCITNISAESAFNPIVAQVKLFRTHQIKLNYLEEKLALAEKQHKQEMTDEEKDQVLDSIINNELIMQAAAREGIIISESQIMDMLKQQAGANATDQQIKEAVAAQYKLPWDEVLKGLVYQFTLQEYIKKAGADDLKKLEAPPTQEEILSFYNSNKAKFVNPDMVRVKHIYFSTQGKTEEEAKAAKKLADDSMVQIKQGKKTFEELVQEVSEDKYSAANGGILGLLTRDNQTHIQLLGNNFLDTVFNLPMEGIHGVYQSNSGYHIVVITEKRSARFLKLTDPIDPSTPDTVAQYIGQNLQKQKVNQAFAQVTEKVIEELRKEAVIKIIDKNIPWK